MTDILQAYQLPNSHLPGSVLLSKYVCRQPSVMAVILAELFGSEPPNDYYCGDSCLINGAQCDILYLSQSSMPVMVQIQKQVTESWLRTILMQSSYVIDYENNRPVLVIFSVAPLPSNVTNMCRISRSKPYAYDLICPLFAQKIKLFCPALFNNYLDATTSHSRARSPILALSSFFSDQHPSAQKSVFFTKHHFYEELYHHAFRFCQRLAIDLDPIQNIPNLTMTVLLKRPRSITSTEHYNNRNKRSSIDTRNPSKRRHQSIRHSVTTHQGMSAPRASAMVLPGHSTTRNTTINRSRSPSTPARSQTPDIYVDNEDEDDELQDDDSGENGNRWAITDVRQHDHEVIRDFCREQLEMDKDWKTIYEEGFGKYFAYKNRESLKRSMQKHLNIHMPVVNSVEEHDIHRIMRFCHRLFREGDDWDTIYQKGKDRVFAFDNSYKLQKTYFKHIDKYKAKLTDGSW